MNVVRSGLATFIKAYDDLELVGEPKTAWNGQSLPGEQADVILMDLMMPEMMGLREPGQY